MAAEVAPGKLATGRLQFGKQETDLIQCTPEKPICLNRPRPKERDKKTGKMKPAQIIEDCNGGDYEPATELNLFSSVLSNEAIPSQHSQYDKKKKPDAQCYSVELAWFIVIKDIKNFISLLIEGINDSASPPAPAEKAPEPAEKAPEPAEKAPAPAEKAPAGGGLYYEYSGGMPPDDSVTDAPAEATTNSPFTSISNKFTKELQEVKTSQGSRKIQLQLCLSNILNYGIEKWKIKKNEVVTFEKDAIDIKENTDYFNSVFRISGGDEQKNEEIEKIRAYVESFVEFLQPGKKELLPKGDEGQLTTQPNANDMNSNLNLKNEILAFIFLRKLYVLISSPGFTEFSDMLDHLDKLGDRFQSALDTPKAKDSAPVKEFTKEKMIEQMEDMKELFEKTLFIMNDKNLLSSYYTGFDKNSASDINQIYTILYDENVKLIGFFDQYKNQANKSEPIKGGGNKEEKEKEKEKERKKSKLQTKASIGNTTNNIMQSNVLGDVGNAAKNIVKKKVIEGVKHLAKEVVSAVVSEVVKSTVMNVILPLLGTAIPFVGPAIMILSISKFCFTKGIEIRDKRRLLRRDRRRRKMKEAQIIYDNAPDEPKEEKENLKKELERNTRVYEEADILASVVDGKQISKKINDTIERIKKERNSIEKKYNKSKAEIKEEMIRNLYQSMFFLARFKAEAMKMNVKAKSTSNNKYLSKALIFTGLTKNKGLYDSIEWASRQEEKVEKVIEEIKTKNPTDSEMIERIKEEERIQEQERRKEEKEEADKKDKAETKKLTAKVNGEVYVPDDANEEDAAGEDANEEDVAGEDANDEEANEVETNEEEINKVETNEVEVEEEKDGGQKHRSKKRRTKRKKKTKRLKKKVGGKKKTRRGKMKRKRITVRR